MIKKMIDKILNAEKYDTAYVEQVKAENYQYRVPSWNLMR